MATKKGSARGTTTKKGGAKSSSGKGASSKSGAGKKKTTGSTRAPGLATKVSGAWDAATETVKGAVKSLGDVTGVGKGGGQRKGSRKK